MYYSWLIRVVHFRQSLVIVGEIKHNGKINTTYVIVRVKTSLVHTSDFVWLMTCKNFLECYTKFKLSAMIKVMYHLLMLQIVT